MCESKGACCSDEEVERRLKETNKLLENIPKEFLSYLLLSDKSGISKEAYENLISLEMISPDLQQWVEIIDGRAFIFSMVPLDEDGNEIPYDEVPYYEETNRVKKGACK